MSEWIFRWEATISRVQSSTRGMARYACLALLGTAPVHATTPSSGEESTIAAYVFNIIKFTDWPQGTFAANDAQLTLCTDATDRLGREIDTLNGRTANGLSIRVDYLPQGDLKRCQVLYVAQPQNACLLETQLPVLTIHGFDQSRGIVRLFREHDRLSFAIDLLAARTAGLRISAKLINVAASVIGSDPTEGRSTTDDANGTQ